MKKKILFICGSLNQTTMMHKIARHLQNQECYFTPFYADGLLGWLSKKGYLDFTILGGRHRRSTEAYLDQEDLPVDFGGHSRDYDLVVTCTDLVVQKNIRDKPLVLIQEGITEPEGLVYHLVRALNLPRFLANTASTGLSDAYTVFCVASPGYRDLFIQKGVKAEKIAVTGIPNFDDVHASLENDFPHRCYVLAATSCARETFKPDDRVKFIREARRIAGHRQLIFKLHPNEDVARARREIREHAPEALVYATGDTNAMIANCETLVTQYSSVVYIGLALGKKVHSYYDVERLRDLTPVQNGAASARRIAEICTRLLKAPHKAQQRSTALYRSREPGF